jgi:hypothetical protein
MLPGFVYNLRHRDRGLLGCVREDREDVHRHDTWVGIVVAVQEHNWSYAHRHE